MFENGDTKEDLKLPSDLPEVDFNKYIFLFLLSLLKRFVQILKKAKKY